MAITNSIGKRSLNSVSGENAAFTVTQTDNTSGTSNAYTYINVAGTSAGDAYIVNSVSGTTDWSRGIDTSDFSGYVISRSSTPGTTNTMRMSAAGLVNWPLQCAFFGYKTSDSTNATGNGTTVLISSYTEIYDQNADFDSSSGAFTAPRDGYYLINGSIQFTVVSAAMTRGFIQIYDIDSTGGYSITDFNAATIRTVGTTVCLNTKYLGFVTSGVRLGLRGLLDNGAGNTATISGGIVTYFQGALLS